MNAVTRFRVLTMGGVAVFRLFRRPRCGFPLRDSVAQLSRQARQIWPEQGIPVIFHGGRMSRNFALSPVRNLR